MMEILRVPERGSTEVPEGQWARLEHSQEFWKLVERGIVRVEQLGPEKVRIVGSCFVGRANLGPDITIEVHEKVPGSMLSLLGYATSDRFRLERFSSPASELGELIFLLIRQFVDELKGYVARGRGFQYRRERLKGALAGGRIDVTRTLQLRARGLTHLFSFERNLISFDTGFNRTMLAALREVERIGSLIELEESLISSVRAIALLFRDCLDSRLVFTSRTEHLHLANAVYGEQTDRRLLDLLSLAILILSHESFELSASSESTAPRAWFMNLESLFEEAVRVVLRQKLGETISVLSGKMNPRPIFSSFTGEYRANPDYVIEPLSSAGQPAACIGDAKYKAWIKSGSQPDVYQLLVHAEAYSAKSAFLVYPGETYEAFSLGDTPGGLKVTLFSLEITNLQESLGRLLRELGVEASREGALGTEESTSPSEETAH